MLRLSSRILHARISIFIKLFVVFIGISGIMVFFADLYFNEVVKKNDLNRLAKDKNRLQYIDYLISYIGNPINLEKAQKLADEFSILIRIEGHDLSFASGPKIPTMREYERESRARRYTFDDTAIAGRHENRVFTLVYRGNHRFLFALPQTDIGIEMLSGLAIIAIAGLLLLYGATKWLLAPIKWLMVGVEQVAIGNLDYEVPVRSNDELSSLITSFNQMTRRIRGIIHSKEQLLFDVSHELRSPLMRIKLALAVKNDKYKDQIQKNLLDLERMINELLESARLDSGLGGLRLKTIDIGDLTSSVCSVFQDESPGIVLNSPSGKFLAPADADRVSIVLKNTIENAIKYSSHQDRPIEVSVRDLKEMDSIEITVKDYGLGIPQKNLATIFEPFYRVDKSRQRETGGFGIGLSLCKKIMDAHSGEIRVQSKEGAGTQISMLFKKHLDPNPNL